MTKKNKTLIKIGVIILAVLFFLTCSVFVIDSLGPANPKCYKKFFLSTFNGSYTAEGSPATYWQIEPKQDKEGVRVPTYARFSVTTHDSSNVGEVWINISDLKESELLVTIGSGLSTYKSAGTITITSKEVKQSQDGWFKVFDVKDTENFTSFTSKYVWVGFSNDVRVREIAFKDVDGHAPESVDLRGMSISDSPLMEASKLKGQQNNVNYVNDEQTTFKK